MKHAIKAPLHALFARFHRDEQGTTITEFVVVLPVFVLIFSATLALSTLQHAGIEAQINATTLMWEEAIAVQNPAPNTPISSPHTSASSAATTSRNRVDSHTKSKARAYLSNRWTAAEGGHLSESQAMLDPLVNSNYVSADFGLSDYNKLYQAHSRYGESTLDQLTGSAEGLFDTEKRHAAFNLLNDGSGAAALPSSITTANTNVGLYPLLNPSSTLADSSIYDDARNAGGSSRLAVAAGLRYGSVRGTNEVPVNHPWLPGSTEASAGFDTLVAPKAHTSDDEWRRTNYVAHMTLMNESLYSTLLAIDYDETFAYDESY